MNLMNQTLLVMGQSWTTAAEFSPTFLSYVSWYFQK